MTQNLLDCNLGLPSMAVFKMPLRVVPATRETSETDGRDHRVRATLYYERNAPSHSLLLSPTSHNLDRRACTRRALTPGTTPRAQPAFSIKGSEPTACPL